MRAVIARNAAALLLVLSLCSNAAAFQPHNGLWYNPSEPGSGYVVEIQNGILQLGVYAYESGGSSEWYLAAGALTNTGTRLSATLDKYRNGQCISCPYTGPPFLAGNDGPVTITFTSETSATLSLPGGRTSTITPWDFGFGALPVGLLGEWVFVYDIITTFADRFNFSATLPATVDGNGIAYDPVRGAGCQYYVSGPTAGLVICVDVTTTGAVQNQYAFRYGLDETYGGVYISTSGNGYAMKGFRIKGSDGVSNLASMGNDPMVSASKEAQARSAAFSAPLDRSAMISAPDDATLQAALAEMAEALRAALR